MSTTAVQKTESFLPARVLDGIRSIMTNVPALLPPDIPFEQFRAGLWLELQSQALIAECSGDSVAAAIVKAANAGLLPGRDCHLIPFKVKGRYEATLVPNYAGIILALERSGKVRKAFAHAVYSHDTFEVDYLEDRFSHKPHLTSQRGTLVCFYGCVLLKDGSRHLEVMTLEQVDAIRRAAPRHDTGPWATHYEEMARKTALKRVAKYVRLSPQQQQLLADDDERERSDIPTERFQATVADVYGDQRAIPDFAREAPTVPFTPPPLTRELEDIPPPPIDAPGAKHAIPEPDDIPDPPQRTGGQSFLDQITAVMRAHGESDDAIQDYWHRTYRRCKVASAVAIPPAWLPKLLEERREYYLRRQAQAETERVRAAEVEVPGTETETGDTPGDWRAALLPLLGVIHGDDELLSTAYDAANDEHTPDDIGQAVLARAHAWQAEQDAARAANTDA